MIEAYLNRKLLFRLSFHGKSIIGCQSTALETLALFLLLDLLEHHGVVFLFVGLVASKTYLRQFAIVIFLALEGSLANFYTRSPSYFLRYLGTAPARCSPLELTSI